MATGSPQQRGWSVVKDEAQPEKEQHQAIRARQRAIGRELRRMFDEVVREPVPDEFMDLLKQIDIGDGENQGGAKS